jgi:hypothetical protein
LSYDIELVEPTTKETIVFEFTHQIKGGTYQMGGTDKAKLNITYNYSPFYYKFLGKKGIRTIYGLTGAESIPLFKKAISNLKDDVDADYWKATEGNAKKALFGLLTFARLRPDGIWQGD